MIETLDNKKWYKENIIPKMFDDSFYYGYLGKYALSSSAFKTILTSWDDYLVDQEKLFSKDVALEKENQSLRDGRLIHLAILEPHRLNDLTIIDSTKGSKLYKEAVLDKNPAEVYTTREIKKCTALANNVTMDFESYCLLDGADKELPGIMMLDGLPVRGKADIIRANESHVIDLKTTSDSSRFEQSIEHWSYDLQGALYLKLFNCNRFSFIILDKITGEVTTRELSTKEIKRGEKKLEKAIDIYKQNKTL
jgi:hypothetical protein